MAWDAWSNATFPQSDNYFVVCCGLPTLATLYSPKPLVLGEFGLPSNRLQMLLSLEWDTLCKPLLILYLTTKASHVLQRLASIVGKCSTTYSYIPRHWWGHSMHGPLKLTHLWGEYGSLFELSISRDRIKRIKREPGRALKDVMHYHIV